MDVKKLAVFGILAVSVLLVSAPASAWFGPFGCGFGFGFPFGPFCRPVPVPVPVAVPVAAPLCAPGVGLGGCDLGLPGPGIGGWGAPGLGLGGCGLGAPGLGLGGCGLGAPGLGLGGCGLGAPGLGLGGIGLGGVGSGLGFNNLAIPGPAKTSFLQLKKYNVRDGLETACHQLFTHRLKIYSILIIILLSKSPVCGHAVIYKKNSMMGQLSPGFRYGAKNEQIYSTISKSVTI